MDNIIQSPRGIVEFGDFTEVLAPPGRYLNDHCLIHDGRQWHFFGIAGPIGKGCLDEGSEVSFAHATSDDLTGWTLHDDVLQVQGRWPETTHVFAPHVIRRDDTYYMLYTALDDDLNQRICLATSSDLFAWRRHPHSPVIVPSLHWAKWPGYGLDRRGKCRDPHVMRLKDGRYVAYWVAELQPRYGDELTCVAASLSHDLVHWHEVGPVFVRRAWDQPPTRAVESPCVVNKDGQYWLFFKHGWWTHVCHSDDPLDFLGRDTTRIGFCHASEVFEWQGRWMISHCSAAPRDYMYRDSNRTRGLFMGQLDWPIGQHPRLAPRNQTVDTIGSADA